MSEYQKYQHVEKLGTDEVGGILDGIVYVFPKIDGTNGHVWQENGVAKFGSRKRELTLDNDNAGFMNALHDNEAILEILATHPNWHLYGEWLVPHTLKTYREGAWRRFYVFDVFDTAEMAYLHYDVYSVILNQYDIEYIAPLSIYKNPSSQRIVDCMQTNDYLVKDGEGIGEGVVCKNYEYRNKFGRQTWAKVVNSDFKAKHRKSEKPSVKECNDHIEEVIVEGFLSLDIVDKVHANITNEMGGWSSKYIGRLLGTVYHDFVTECLWEIVKKHKSPIINFKKLNKFCTMRVKELKPELF